jgi:hypothetical protein
MSSELMDELRRIQILSKEIEDYDRGFDEAIVEVLTRIDLKRRAYKANGLITESNAMDVLYKELIETFENKESN